MYLNHMWDGKKTVFKGGIYNPRNKINVSLNKYKNNWSCVRTYLIKQVLKTLPSKLGNKGRQARALTLFCSK